MDVLWCMAVVVGCRYWAAQCVWCCCWSGGAACLGLQAGGSDVFLPVAHLQLKVGEAALLEGVGAVVIWREFRCFN